MDIQELMARAVAKWPFDDRNYPGFNKLSDPQRVLFGMDHILKHMIIEVAELVRFVEQSQHTPQLAERLSHATIQRDITPLMRKILVDALRLASFVGISEADLGRSLQEYESSVFLTTETHE